VGLAEGVAARNQGNGFFVIRVAEESQVGNLTEYYEHHISEI
jgi:DNA-binding GntR family transcriptional regulator